MSDTPLRLAIDFDHVLHNPDKVLKGYKMGVPIEGAIEALRKLKKDKALIVIHSVWADTDQKREAMSKWLNFFNIPYDFITNVKPVCDFYIDNRAIYHTSWKNTLHEITNRLELEDGKQNKFQEGSQTQPRDNRKTSPSQVRSQAF